MEIRCPKCNSRDIRYSHLSTPKERFASLLGIHPLRCRDCRERFVARLWDPSDLPYARCPRCLNMTLSTWSPSHYHVPAGRGIKLFFGASPYRCESCRCNFVSFRARKYRFKRARKPASQEAPAGAPTSLANENGESL